MSHELPPSLFSRDSLPSGWKSTHVQPAIKTELIARISKSSDGEIIEIPRSSNSVTFLLDSPHGKRVYQYGPPLDDTIELNERQNPNKFNDSQRRVNWLHANGIRVPYIHESGIVDITDERRAFIVMDYMSGEGGDSFLQNNPDLHESSYMQAGREFGRLMNTPLHSSDNASGNANENVFNKVVDSLNTLGEQGIFDNSDRLTIAKDLYERLTKVADVPTTYIHADPFPVNWQIEQIGENISVGLLDIEAIRVGHPLVEGIARAAQWAARDWFSISESDDHPEALPALIHGYNQEVTTTLSVDISTINQLTDISELVWLPQAILYELMKQSPEEGPERRKAAIMHLVE